MESIEEKMARLLAIEDPHEAYIAIATDPELPLDIAEKLVDKYVEIHNIDEDDMAFYPDGERVRKSEMFQAFCTKEE